MAMVPWTDGVATDMIRWQKRSIILSAFGLVGFGALLGAGTVYLYILKNRIERHFQLQAAAIQEIQHDVAYLKSSFGNLRRNESSPDDDEYVTADEEDENEHRGKTGNAAGDGLAQFLSKMDELLDGNTSKQHEAFKTLKTYKDKLGRSFDFWWRLAKATHLEAATADANGDKKLKKEHFENALSYAEKALHLNDKSADAHKWYAITVGSCSEFLGVNEKIKSGFKFKEHVDRAVELNPGDPTCYYLLGRFCFDVSQLSWIERRVAATLFSAPPTATIKEALDYFKKSENLKVFMDNRFFIAKCYNLIGDNKKALKWLDAAASLPVESSVDKVTKEQVVKLRSKLKN